MIPRDDKMSRKNVTFVLDPKNHGHEMYESETGEDARNGIPSSNTEYGMPTLPRPLTLEEKRYLLAVERGDLTTVRKMLGRAESVGMDPNCVDALGRGALALAIDAENLSMVQLLVVLGVRTGDALLHAVDAGFVEAAQLLLEHEELVHKPDKPYSWECVDWTTSRYTPDMTPLVLAAHRDNYEILKMLLDRGATLPMPHDLRCGCSTCVSEEEADSLRRSVTRLNEYRALASPSLLALSSGDPLLAAFQLSWELRGLAFAEPECRTEYLELRRQCQQFAVDLLQQARSSAELAVILNHDPDNPPYEDGDTMALARLQLAILYKQKKFVAHPYVQQLLSSLWYAGLPGFRRQPTLRRALAVIRVVAASPFLCLSYALSPSCGPARLLKQPFVKFLVHASCYLFFLLLLILVSQRAEVQFSLFFADESRKEEVLEQLKYQRGNPPSALEWIVLVYVIGFIWEETSEMFHLGLHRYLRNLWNFIDFLRNSLYILGAVVRAVAYFEQQNEIRLDSAAALIPRENWDNFDPELVADGLLAGANIFSALKLVHLFSINPHLGPLQISLGRMVNDIVKFLFIYSLVLFSFACGLNQLLWYFADLERQKCFSLPGGQPDWENNGDSCTKWRSFSSLFEASQSLFWASFGNVGIDNFELEGIKSYTRFWGLLMFGSYSVINVIVLLNLLIAMMSTSYAMIEERADTEWKFARTKLWLSYFQDSSTLPPPFNILPTPKKIARLLQCGKSSSKRVSRAKPTGVTSKSDEDRNTPEDGHLFRRYDAMMRALVWRYVSAAQRIHELAPATEDAVGELRSDLSSLKCRLLDVFAKNGLDVSSESEEAGGEPPAGKRMRGWERRLLKDFAVTPQPAGAAGAPLLMGPPPPNETPLDKFRRAARLVVLRSSTQRWRRAIRGLCYQSQIGRSHPGRGRESLTKLQRAMAEAQRLAVQVELNTRVPSPLDPLAAATAPAAAAAANNVLQLLRQSSQSEDLNNSSEPETISLIPLPTISPPETESAKYSESNESQNDLEKPPTPTERQSEITGTGTSLIDIRIDTREETPIVSRSESPVESYREDTLVNKVDTRMETPVDNRSEDLEDIDEVTGRDETQNDTIDNRDEIRIDITEEDDDEPVDESIPPNKSSRVAGLIGIFKQKGESAGEEIKPPAPPPPKLQITASPKTPMYYSPARSPNPSPIRRSPSPRDRWF